MQLGKDNGVNQQWPPLYHKVGVSNRSHNRKCHTLNHVRTLVLFSFTDKSLEVSVGTISSTSLNITAQPPPGLEMVEVNCTLTAKETSSYIRTVSLDNTTDGGAQGLTDNLVPYTNYTATCLVFKDGVDQCYIGSDTTQTYTDGEYYSVSSIV